MAEIVNCIHISHLQKEYQVHEREEGMWAALRGLVQPHVKMVTAINDVTFDIAHGEFIGLLGPNGAGKTTLLKILAGLLHPTVGEARVLGYTPWQRKKQFLRQIAFVMGQRSQLWWDIPAGDSFELYRAIYQVPYAEHHQMLDELTELLNLGTLLHKPVRTLSLGERMKCELTAALLHRPRILFLDEPTIGLDVPMQRRLRAFLKTYHQNYEATIILTSHNMVDVVEMCQRVVIIHHGTLLYDGALASLGRHYSPYKIITVKLHDQYAHLAQLALGDILVSAEGTQVTVRVPQAITVQVAERLLAELPVDDLNISDTPIDEIIEQIFCGGVA